MSNRVVVTGIGFVTSIGNNYESVLNSLQNLRHGIELFSELNNPECPCPAKLAGTIKGFTTDSIDSEDWVYPESYKIKRETIRGFAPHVLYAYCAFEQAMHQAQLSPELISNPRTGIYTASGGSPFMIRRQFLRTFKYGPNRCSPMGVVNAVVGTLTFNLAAHFKIQGSSCGFASACASSGHALGYAFDEIASGRQDRMFVVGAEDINYESVMPFTGMRALTLSTNPNTASRPFDKDRDGFVCTGGATVIILENERIAQNRKAKIWGEFLGWGQSCDGHNVAISHPEGEGLFRAMNHALESSKVKAEAIDYINAHATSTPIGDSSEIKAIKNVFLGKASPAISSTKALTGHGLSLASIMETAFCILSLNHNFTIGSAHIEALDPEAESLHIIRENLPQSPNLIMNNSSGFGGANVSLLLKKYHS